MKKFLVVPDNIWILLLIAAVLTGCEKKEMPRETALQVLSARHLGLAYLEEDQISEAEAQFKRVTELAPDEPLGYANLGVIAMRRDDYRQAEAFFQQALDKAPYEPNVRLNLSEVYRQTGREDQGVELLRETLEQEPNHVRTLFRLAQIYLEAGDPELAARATELLKRLVELRPGNLMARLYLVDVFIRADEADEAAAHLETIRGLLPNLSEQALEYYKNAHQGLLTGDTKEALAPFIIFHNLLKVSPLYQASGQQLVESTRALLGFPVTNFSSAVSVEMEAQGAITDAIRFVNVTFASGLAAFNLAQTARPRAIAVADYDSDGDEDIYLGAGKGEMARLLLNQEGHFLDIGFSAQIHHQGFDRDAVFADFDNDGFLDLFVLNDVANRLYRNIGVGQFEDVAAHAGVANSKDANQVSFADYDHDGDLDLYMLCNGRNRFYRNNLDGTFSDLSETSALCQEQADSREAVFADFDDDGDLDIFVVNSTGESRLFTNHRQGLFENIAQSRPGQAVAIGDHNNDGMPDLFICGSSAEQNQLLVNNSGSFLPDSMDSELLNQLKEISANDARFLDFDNDGFLDLLLAGKMAGKENTLFLFRGLGQGKFEDRSSQLPDSLAGTTSIAQIDYDKDGDLDLLTADSNGAVGLLRNDGGNANHYLRIQLVGVRTGSGKNNGFGIGAKMEVGAQEFYQSRTVDAPISHFGLGQHERAEVVRVLWPNGTPQNMIDLKSDQFFVEKQVLKGSCMFLYGWDGSKCELITDVMWRSALGMPLGIMAGETMYAFPNSSQDYFRIPGDALREKDGRYVVQLTEELWETAFTDEVKFYAVDHPDSIDIYLDERFVPPPIPPLHIFKAGSDRRELQAAFDENSRDVLSEIQNLDNKYVANFEPERYQGLTEFHDLILDFGALKNSERVLLFLHGWVFPSDASINVALAQGQGVKPSYPHLQVRDQAGHWQTVVENLGFPMGKKKFMITDLTGKFLSDDHRIRIRTNMQIYWDYAFVSTANPESKLVKTEMTMMKADLHYRGFSRPYRLGGRFGPHWFDYSDVDTNQKWRDLIGNYTRFGDVLPLLAAADDKYVVVNSGDEVTIEFDAKSLPELPGGWTRDFIIYTDGWVKDGDLNTAHGRTVEPLPFHNMTRYPYGPNEAYPDDEEHQTYLRTYQTRAVTTQQFRTAVRTNRETASVSKR